MPAADVRDADDWQFLLVKSKAMLNNLTGLRFYTALWVFLYHFFPVYTDLPKVDLLEVGYLGVDVFFVLSGFILTYVYYGKFFVNKISIKDYYNFIIKRFAKIYPLHFILTLIFIPLLFVGKYVFHQDALKVYPNTLINNFLLIHAWGTTSHYSWNFPSWSISAEWFAYLFLFAPAAFIYRKSRLVFFIVCVVILGAFMWKWIKIPEFTMDRYTMNGLPRIIPEFLLGVLAGLLKLKVILNKKMASFIFMLALLFLSLFFYQRFYFQQLCIFGFAAIIFALSYDTYFNKLFGSRQLIYLGNISYAFYLTQFLSLIIYEQVYRLLFSKLTTEYIVILQFLIAFSINFIMASSAYRYIEEPVRLYLVKKLSRNKINR